MKKDSLIVIAIVLLGVVLYGLTLRGNVGNPTADQFKSNLDQATQPFELSPERGRYVQIANMVESGTYNLSKKWVGAAYPDVGVSDDGKFDSYFAPGVSYFALPFYLLGSRYDLAQVATFASQAVISLITLVFMYLVGRRIFNLPKWAAFFSVLVFGFASTSWSYAVTLYEHAFSAMFAVTMFYAVWKFAQKETRYAWLYATYVWLAFGFSITVNYPDAVLLLPIMLYFAASTFSFEKITEGIAVSIRWGAIVTFVAFALITSLHFWHNATYYGGWDRLAGELHSYRYQTATTTTALVSLTAATSSVEENAAGIISSHNKSAVGFFHEQAIPNGIFVLLFGDERGLFFFSPIFLFSILGMLYVLRKEKEQLVVYSVPIALIAITIFLYSAWGDPWGGWAYGPRYLIPAMPWLALFVGVALSRGRFLFAKKVFAYVLFLFSSAVALLGALTSNAVPPKSEAVLLPVKTYNFLHDIPFLQDGRGASFIYKTYFADHLSLIGYFLAIYATLVLVVGITLLCSRNNRHE